MGSGENAKIGDLVICTCSDCPSPKTSRSLVYKIHTIKNSENCIAKPLYDPDSEDITLDFRSIRAASEEQIAWSLAKKILK
jgi:hypothetical protein